MMSAPNERRCMKCFGELVVNILQCGSASLRSCIVDAPNAELPPATRTDDGLNELSGPLGRNGSGRPNPTPRADMAVAYETL